MILHFRSRYCDVGVGEGRCIGKKELLNKPFNCTNELFLHWHNVKLLLKYFRAQNSGHLVVISSMSAMRACENISTAYGASKAGVAALAEGVVMKF